MEPKKVTEGGGVYKIDEDKFLLYGPLVENNTIKQYCRLFSIQGTLIKDIIYPIDKIVGLEPIYIKEDGSFIGAAYTKTIEGKTIPLIMSFNKDLDTLWTKSITIDPTKQVYLKDIEATPDGGYVLAGFNYTNTPQYGWVLKIDSLGNTCWPVGCDSTVTTTSVSKELSNKNNFDFQIHPNPTKQHIQLSFCDYVSGDVVISDVSGREVRRLALVGVKEQEIDLGRRLESGVYFCTFYDADGGVWVERFVVLR